MARNGGPKTLKVAQVEIALPGYPAYSGSIEYLSTEAPPTLDETAIQLHSLVNDIVMSIRKNMPTVDGKELG
jgi:hypothetical protein